MGTVIGQGVSFPPRLGADGRVAWSSGPDNIREAIRVILLTEPGERLVLANFGGGLQSLLFEPNTVATRRLVRDRIEQALAVAEPRIVVQSIEVIGDPTDAEAALATITYQLIATQTAEQVTLRVGLTG